MLYIANPDQAGFIILYNTVSAVWVLIYMLYSCLKKGGLFILLDRRTLKSRTHLP